MATDLTNAPAPAVQRGVPPSPTGKSGWPWEAKPARATGQVRGPFPRVTVVTPSYNQGAFIEECIRSVLLQDYPNLEYMVIDGGSRDRTTDVLKHYSQAIDYWVSEPDRGQAHAINKGWRRATGDILAWLNADDLYLPGAISRAVKALEEHPEAGVVYGNGYHVSEQGEILEVYPSEPFDVRRLGDTCYLCQPTTFLRRSVVEAVGYLDETLQYALDYDLWLKAAKHCPFAFVPDFLAHSRLHRDCKTVKQAVPRGREVLNMLYKHYRAVPPLKVGGYARAKMLAWLSDVTGWRKIPFLAGMAGICGVEFLRYNLRMPAAERERWGRGVREGLTKFFRGS